jgi:hypothetical protein
MFHFHLQRCARRRPCRMAPPTTILRQWFCCPSLASDSLVSSDRKATRKVRSIPSQFASYSMLRIRRHCQTESQNLSDQAKNQSYPLSHRVLPPGLYPVPMRKIDGRFFRPPAPQGGAIFWGWQVHIQDSEHVRHGLLRFRRRRVCLKQSYTLS